MKKLIAVFSILLFAAPAMAVDWSFYGSARIATWYTDRDYGDATVNGQDDLDVMFYVLGPSTSWNIGAFSLGGQLTVA